MQYVMLIYQGTTPLLGTDDVGEVLRVRSSRSFTPTTARSSPTSRLDSRSPARLPANATAVRGARSARHSYTAGPFVADQGGDRRATSCFEARGPRRRDRATPHASRPRRLGGAIEVRPVDDVLGVTVEQVFREEWGRVLAALIGFLGDFDLAEEAAQEAFAVAAERWPREGIAGKPGAGGS